MIEIRHLPPADLGLIHEIDRSEHVTVRFGVVEGQLTTTPVEWDVPTFDSDGTGEHSIHELLEHWTPVLDGGASLIGAFSQGRVAGLAIVDPSLEPGLAWLALLHVSRPFRRTGVATALWAEAIRIAEEAAAVSMYVSATPTGSAVGFYVTKGCVLAETPLPALYESEPEDIHLVCPVGI